MVILGLFVAVWRSFYQLQFDTCMVVLDTMAESSEVLYVIKLCIHNITAFAIIYSSKSKY